MLCAEWWAFEILIFLAGIIGVREQAAMIIIFQVLTQTYMINLGMQESSTALIGNQIGAMNIPLAKRYAKIIFCETVAIGILVSILLFTLRERIVGIFTSDPALTSLCLSVFPFYCIYGNNIDSMLMPFQGMIRALGI